MDFGFRVVCCFFVFKFLIVLMQAAPLLQAVVSLYIEKRNFVNNFGLNTFLEAEWARLRVPAVLRTFWLSRAALLLVLQVTLIQLLKEKIVFDGLFVSGTWQPASPLIVHNWQGGSGEGLRDRDQCPWHDQHRLLPLPLVWCRLPGATILFLGSGIITLCFLRSSLRRRTMRRNL